MNKMKIARWQALGVRRTKSSEAIADEYRKQVSKLNDALDEGTKPDVSMDGGTFIVLMLYIGLITGLCVGLVLWRVFG